MLNRKIMNIAINLGTLVTILTACNFAPDAVIGGAGYTAPTDPLSEIPDDPKKGDGKECGEFSEKMVPIDLNSGCAIPERIVESIDFENPDPDVSSNQPGLILNLAQIDSTGSSIRVNHLSFETENEDAIEFICTREDGNSGNTWTTRCYPPNGKVFDDIRLVPQSGETASKIRLKEISFSNLGCARESVLHFVKVRYWVSCDSSEPIEHDLKVTGTSFQELYYVGN